jgi:hypothetical protein
MKPYFRIYRHPTRYHEKHRMPLFSIALGNYPLSGTLHQSQRHLSHSLKER